MIKVGLTGNIASGKSGVQNILLLSGYKVFDADESAHFHLVNSKVILDEFGTNDRNILAKTVFSDKTKLKKLEEIIHPLVRQDIQDFFAVNNSEKAVFASVPLLFEAGFEDLFDKIIFVSAPYNVRLERLIKRNGYNFDYAKLRLDSQSDEKSKIPRCDCTIVNDSTFEELERRVKECLKLLL